jgi:hypothetical protein
VSGSEYFAMKGRVCMLSQNLREHLAHGLLVAGRKVAHVANDKCLFECGQDWFGEGRFEQPGGLPVYDWEGGKVWRCVRLAGNYHDEQVWSVGVVAGLEMTTAGRFLLSA